LNVRVLTILLVLGGTLAFGGVSWANDIHLPKTGAAELKQVCDKAGGSFSQGAARYGCGTNCKGGAGTDCLVTCEPDKRCVAQVIGAHRPRTVEQALTTGKKR
jgi:hypothetical protein